MAASFPPCQEPCPRKRHMGVMLSDAPATPGAALPLEAEALRTAVVAPAVASPAVPQQDIGQALDEQAASWHAQKTQCPQADLSVSAQEARSAEAHEPHDNAAEPVEEPRDDVADSVERRDAFIGEPAQPLQSEVAHDGTPKLARPRESAVAHHSPAAQQLQRLPAQLTLLETYKQEELALHDACDRALREIHSAAKAQSVAASTRAKGLEADTEQRMSFADWSARVAAQERACADASRQALSDASSLEILAGQAARALECLAGLQRRREKRHNKGVLQLKALQEAMEKMAVLKAEKEREVECRALSEKNVEKLVATLKREKRNAVDSEFAHQVRHELAAAKERGETGEQAAEHARQTSLRRVSGDMLSQVDSINRANRKAGNKVTEWDCRDATEGAAAPAPKRARPQVPAFAASA